LRHAPWARYLITAVMHSQLAMFFLHWGTTALSLVSALLLGFANAVVRPLLIVLTLPLTLLSFGLFLLVINALMIMLVSALVKGFTVSSFWTAFFASIFIALLSIFIGAFFQGGGAPAGFIQTPSSGVWL